jgi:hypothetical protein
MQLATSVDALAGTSPATLTAGADAQLIGQNLVRNGLQVSVDTAATAPVYFLLRAGTCSATNFDFVLASGGIWNGTLGEGPLWRGAVRFFSTAGGKVGVLEA